MSVVSKPPPELLTAICNAVYTAIDTADFVWANTEIVGYNGVVYIAKDSKSSYKIHATWSSDEQLNVRIVLKANVVTK